MAERIRREIGTDLLTVIAEGDLRSDGYPAKLSAEQRAGMWLDAGADLVLQLPVFSALGGYGKKDFAVAALIQRLHSADRVILPCRPLPGQTAEECGELLRRCAMLMFRERPDYRKELQENLRRRMPFLRAQMEAVAFCIPEVAGLLQLPENRQSVCMLDAMLQLYYIVRVDFMETRSGAEDMSISAVGNRAQGGRAGSPSGGEERRRLCFERRAARELKKILENQSRDFLMNISGSTERAVSRILDISGEIGEETCLQEIVERVEAAFPNRDMAQLFLLRIVLNIRHSDMLISGLYTYVPYCRVLGERGQRQDEIGHIEELSWVPFMRETGSEQSREYGSDQKEANGLSQEKANGPGQSREDSPGQGGQPDETLRLLLAIDRRAGLLFG